MSLLKSTSFLLLASVFALTSCGNDPDAARLARKVRAGDGTAQAIYNQAYAADRAGKIGKAIKGYARINKSYPLSPSAPDARFRHAQLLEKKGDLLDAFESYNSFLSKYPASARYAEAIQRQEAIAHGAASGHIKNSFAGLKSRIDATRTTQMLAKVRDNAPRSASAEKAQFTIGEVFQRKGRSPKAMKAFEKVVSDYPNSSYAPEAQYRIGAILLEQAKRGNQDSANLSRAKNAFNDLLLRYPNSKRAADARRQISGVASKDLKSSYDIAEFYRKKGNTSSALYYYKEVISGSKPGPLRNKASAWVSKLGG